MPDQTSPDHVSRARPLTTTIAQSRRIRAPLCDVCNAPIDERTRIAPEAATHFVQLCGLACHDAWRRSQPVDARLAARGGDLSVGE